MKKAFAFAVVTASFTKFTEWVSKQTGSHVIEFLHVDNQLNCKGGSWIGFVVLDNDLPDTEQITYQLKIRLFDYETFKLQRWT